LNQYGIVIRAIGRATGNSDSAQDIQARPVLILAGFLHFTQDVERSKIGNGNRHLRIAKVCPRISGFCAAAGL